jgi:O-antigen/teichoic acid export membrane protein
MSAAEPTRESARARPTAVEAPSRWLGRRALGETVLTNGALLSVGALTGIVAARALGPAGRGQVAVAISIAAVLWPIAALGLQQAAAYRLAQRGYEAAQAVGLSFVVSLLVGGAMTVVAWALVTVVVHDSATRNAIGVGLLSIPFAILNAVLVGVFQGLRLGRRFNLTRLSTPIVYAVLLVGLVIERQNVTALSVMCIYGAASVAGAVVAVVLLPREARRPKRPSRSFWRAIIRYGMYVNLSSLGYLINRQLPVVLVGAVGSAADAGQYAVGVGYALPVSVVAVALALHTLPDIAAEPDARAQQAVARQRVRSGLIGTLPLACGAEIAAPILIPLAFGARFSPAVPVARVLVVGQAALGISFLLSEVSRGLGRPGVPAIAEWTGVFATAAVLPAALLLGGLTGAAAALIGVYGVVIAILLAGTRSTFWSGGT